MFECLRNYQASLHILTSSVWGFWFLHILINTCYHLAFNSNLAGMKWYLTVILITFSWWLTVLSTFLCIYEPFIYLPWRNVHTKCLSTLKIGLSYYYWVVKVVCIFGIQVPYRIYDLKVFFPFWGLFFHFLSVTLWSTNISDFDEVKQIYFSFCCMCFWCHIQESFCQIWGHGTYPLVCLWSILSEFCCSVTVVPIFPHCSPLPCLPSPSPLPQSIPTLFSMSIGHLYLFLD